MNPYAKLIQDSASKFNVPVGILGALLNQESGFNPKAVSPAGAQGIAQFMPETAKSYGINPFDPTQAIPAAAKYLQGGYNQFKDWGKAIASYNAGAGAVQQYGGIPPFQETQNYVKNILGSADNFAKQLGGSIVSTAYAAESNNIDPKKVQAAKDAGYSDQEIQDYIGGKKVSQNKTSPTFGGITELLSKIGLGILPTAASAVNDVSTALTGGDPTQSNLFYTNEQKRKLAENPLATAGKEGAGILSWLLPEFNLLKGGGALTNILARGGNLALQGGGMGGLNAISQGQNPVQGLVTGAVTNPILGGAGNALTDILPRYIGLRNFGKAGWNLPNVVQGEKIANVSGDTLQNLRNNAMRNINDPLAATEANSRIQGVNEIVDLARKVAYGPKGDAGYTGTPGLEDIVRKTGKVLPSRQGKLPLVENAIQNSNSLFEAYNKISNITYGPEKDPGGKLGSFLRELTHNLREEIIDRSSDSNKTRQIMDMYANQSAINASRGGIGGNTMLDAIGNVAKGGGGEAGLGALAMMVPFLHGLSVPFIADAALTNQVTGPSLAKGLVNLGGAMGKQTGLGVDYSDLLRRLGLSGVQQITNPYATQ